MMGAWFISFCLVLPMMAFVYCHRWDLAWRGRALARARSLCTASLPVVRFHLTPVVRKSVSIRVPTSSQSGFRELSRKPRPKQPIRFVTGEGAREPVVKGGKHGIFVGDTERKGRAPSPYD